jgi:hypothetical protein
MANQLYPVPPRIVDANVDASPGAKLYFYVTGTTTPLIVYTTEAADVPHPSPLVANADGSLPAIWLPTGAAKCVITDASDATLATIDPVVATAGSGLTAADIPFSPTVELPFANVQDAVVGAAESAASGYAAFGLGITGNATLLAALDATNIGAGTYRFDGTTTGTYPTGVAAADTGIIEHWRQAAGAAMQMLYHATTDRIFHRRMTASAWGTWRENITANQGAVEGDTLYRGASAWTRLPKGTANQLLQMNSGATAPEWGGNIVFRPNGTLAGVNGTGAQDVFALDVTLEASTVYEYEIFFSLSKSAGTTPHIISVGYGGTATINNIQRNLLSASATSPSTQTGPTDANGYKLSAAQADITPAITSAAVNVWFREIGTVSINAGGTFIPQYQLSAAPGGAYTANLGGLFKLRKIGAAGANVVVGPWA